MEDWIVGCFEICPKGYIYKRRPQTLEYVKWLNYPWHIYSDNNTLNTPSQMQRECNVVAFGELILSTKLKHKHENDTSKVQNQRCRRSVQLLEHVDVEKDLLHKRVSPSQPYFSKYLKFSQTSTSTPQTWALLWRIEPDSNMEMCQTSQNEGIRDHCLKTASRRTCVDDDE